jgi:diguanylate cyclase (GGDEF)-like protein/putative nucleotidyltransferase with HDIG domain
MQPLRALLDRAVQADRTVPDLATSPVVGARAASFLFAVGGAISFAVVLLPHPSEFDETGFYAIGAVAMLGALSMRLAERHMTWDMLKAVMVIGTVCITCDIYFSGESRGAPAPDNEMLYLWAALYAAYFFSLRWSLATVAWVGVCYGTVLVLSDQGNVIVTRWVETVGTLAIAVLLVHMLQERVRALVAQLADAARTDPLTGLHNRRGFEESFAVEIERARRGGHALTLLVADLDHFKRVNDRLGHATGDAALTRVGKLLRSGKRQIDYSARTGGEEFALILPDTADREGYLVAERLRGMIERAFGDDLVPLTMSVGVAGYPKHGQTADELLRSADRALYAAKELGRNRAVIYSSEVGSVARAPERCGEVQVSTLLSLAEALDLRDAGTADHSQTVGRHCEAVARELGLPPARVERVRLAGILHDIGKLGVSDLILAKPGPLTDEEWEEMRRHPEIGARILGSSEFDDIRSWVLAHHERPDGRGYPSGLRKDEIPLEARILAVADAYEAMTSDRVYRRALGRERAREELRRGSGTQFDPRVVEALLTVLKRAGDALAAAR